MKEVEKSARTVEEAIELALEELGADRRAVEVDVISEGSHGIFGVGADEARVKVRLVEETPAGEAVELSRDEVIEVAQETLETMLDKAGLIAGVSYRADAVVQEAERVPSPIVFDIEGEDLGILIGRRGQTLACFQYIVRLIVGNRMKVVTPPIVIDVNGYKQRRYQSLKVMAQRIAEEVEANGDPFALEPMPAYERRILHLALAEHPGVTTESTGFGEDRKVVIIPRKQ
jgi:spoIIIJ-associated protein